MKTPEEIKIGLERCVHVDCESITDECPYFSIHPCSSFLKKDAIKYINELEARTSLNTLRDAIYEDAVAHGLWERHYGPAYCAELIHDEASELDLAAMDWERDDNYDSEFCEELADVIITALSVAGNLGIDIDEAVRRKMEINRVRPWKHGKDEKK